MHSGNAQTKTLAESLLFYRSMNVDHGLGAARTTPTKEGPRAVSNPDAVKRAQAHRLLTGRGSLAARRGDNCTNENEDADTSCTCSICTGRAQRRWLSQQEKSQLESGESSVESRSRADGLSTGAEPAPGERVPAAAPAAPAAANRKGRASFLPKKGLFNKKGSSTQELASDSVRVSGEDSPTRVIREDAANQLQFGV